MSHFLGVPEPYPAMSIQDALAVLQRSGYNTASLTLEKQPAPLPARPIHKTASTYMSLQMQCLFLANACPISLQSKIREEHIQWLTQCPDALLYVVYNRPTDGLNAYLTTRIIAHLKTPKQVVTYDEILLSTLMKECTGGWTEAMALMWASKMHMEHGNIANPREERSDIADMLGLTLRITLERTYPIRLWMCGQLIRTYYSADADDAAMYCHYIDRSLSSHAITQYGADLVLATGLRGGTSGWSASFVIGLYEFPTVLYCCGEYHTLWFASRQAMYDYFTTAEETDGQTYVVIEDPGRIAEVHVYPRLRGGAGGDKKGGKRAVQQQPRDDQKRRRKMTSADKVNEDAMMCGLIAHQSSKGKKLARRRAPPVHSGASSSSSDIPYELEDDQLEQSIATSMDKVPSTVLNATMDLLRTTGSDGKAKIVSAIASGIVQARGYTTGEPDYDARTDSWVKCFPCGATFWNFDGRVTEKDRLVLLSRVACLSDEDIYTELSRHLFEDGQEDDYLKAQHAFGWGARNFREFPPGKFNLGLPLPESKPAPIDQLVVLYTFARSSRATDDVVNAAVAFAQKDPTPDHYKILNDVCDALPAGPTDPEAREKAEEAFKSWAKRKFADPELFIPPPPPQPEETDVTPEGGEHCVRYATDTHVPETIIPVSTARSIRSLSLRLHLALQRFVEGFEDGAVLARSKVSEYATHELKEVPPWIRYPIIGLAGAAAIGLPLASAISGMLTGPLLFRHATPLCGVRLYSKKVERQLDDSAVLIAESASPENNRVTLSTDVGWSEQLLAERTKPSSHIEYATSIAPERIYSIYAVAHMLNTSCPAQVAETETHDPQGDYQDNRSKLHSKTDIIEKFPHIVVMHTTSTNHRYCTHDSLLVIQSVFDDLTANYTRLSTLMSSPSPFNDMLAVVTTDVTRMTRACNIPMPPKGRLSIQHDTAVAVVLACWALIKADCPELGNY